MNVEAIWIAARDRHGRRVQRNYDSTGTAACRDRRTPGPGVTAVLLALVDGPAHGCEVARRAGQDQGNTSRWLDRLAEYRFVESGDTVPAAHVRADRRGGRPARVWHLTTPGWELVAALRAKKEIPL